MPRTIRGRRDMSYMSDHRWAALQTVTHRPTNLLSCFPERKSGAFSVLRLSATLAQESANSHKPATYLLATDPYSVTHFECTDLRRHAVREKCPLSACKGTGD